MMENRKKCVKRADFGRRLKKLRDKRGISQQVLADFCGISKNTVARYERGERIPNIETAELIADFFGVTIEYLYRAHN